MSKMNCVESIIADVLRDGDWHMIGEMKAKIMEKNENLLENPNYLSVVLNRLKTRKRMIESNERGSYRLRSDKGEAFSHTDAENKDYKDETCKNDNTVYREKVLKCWRKCYNESIGMSSPNYEMTEQQFRNGKWLYELNREMEKLIISFNALEEDLSRNAKATESFV